MRGTTAIGLLLVMMSIPAFADEFNAAAKAIESHYGIRRLSPALMGFASFIAKPAMWGSGVGGLKIAVFEDEGRTLTPSVRELDQLMLGSLDGKWQPFVRVDSRRDGEAVVIYSKVDGKHMIMLIGSVDRSDISLVQIRVNPKAFQEWEASPKDKAKNATHKR